MLTRNDFITPDEVNAPLQGRYYDFKYCIPNVICCEFLCTLRIPHKYLKAQWDYAYDDAGMWPYWIKRRDEADTLIGQYLTGNEVTFRAQALRAQHLIIRNILDNLEGFHNGVVTFNSDTWAFEFRGRNTITTPTEFTC